MDIDGNVAIVVTRKCSIKFQQITYKRDKVSEHIVLLYMYMMNRKTIIQNKRNQIMVNYQKWNINKSHNKITNTKSKYV